MFAWHKPPRSQPTQAVAKAKMRCVTPPAFRMFPIRTKSGAARIGNEFAVCAIFCGTIVGLRPPRPTKAKEASPIEA